MREKRKMKKKDCTDWLIAFAICLMFLAAGIFLWLFTKAEEAHAGVITSEKTLGGISWLRQQVIDKGLKLPDQEDIELLAEVMYHENWHTDRDHLAAYYTGGVVLNRVKRKDFPNTIKEVLYQRNPMQYITTDKFFTEDLPQECYEMAVNLLKYGVPEMPISVIYQSTHKSFGSGTWREINGEYFNYE